MTTTATRLVAPRLAHIAGVDHPAHQIEGFIVAKALGDSPNFLEGLTMTFDVKELAKSLETPLTKDTAAETIETMRKALSFLVSQEAEKAVSKATDEEDANTSKDDTEVTKDDGDEMTMAQKAASWDVYQSKSKADDGDADDVSVAKALTSNLEFVAMKKQLDAYQARELTASVEVAVKKAAGALQTETAGFVKAIIAAGGVETETGKDILKSLKATGEQLAVGGSFTKEIGANGMEISSDLKTANTQLKAIAKALHDEEGIPMTKAFSEAAKRNPTLRDTLEGGAN